LFGNELKGGEEIVLHVEENDYKEEPGSGVLPVGTKVRGNIVFNKQKDESDDCNLQDCGCIYVGADERKIGSVDKVGDVVADDAEDDRKRGIGHHGKQVVAAGLENGRHGGHLKDLLTNAIENNFFVKTELAQSQQKPTESQQKSTETNLRRCVNTKNIFLRIIHRSISNSRNAINEDAQICGRGEDYHSQV
jgi:hypothetical protein